MQILGLEKITQISVGNNFCLALDWRGKVFSWGRSEQNQLGRRLVVDRRRTAVDRRHTADEDTTIDELRNDLGLLPGLVALPQRKKFISIHAGSDHAFAIDSNGDTWAWGLNNFGQTGIRIGAGKGSSTIMIPQKVISLIGHKMKMIQGGRHHSIGITRSGECLVWGRMDGAQMGLDISSLPINDPKKVISERGRPRILLQPVALPIPECTHAAAGSDHNILVTSKGRAYSWGFNATYQCGQGPSIDDIPIATLIDNPSVRDKKFCWAGAGGQYSILASPHEYTKSDGKQLTNGLHHA
jgi:regulator of chromosome condensation